MRSRSVAALLALVFSLPACGESGSTRTAEDEDADGADASGDASANGDAGREGERGDAVADPPDGGTALDPDGSLSLDGGDGIAADSGDPISPPTGCTENEQAVCVDVPSGTVYFHDAQGVLLDHGAPPREYVLPAMGSVTVVDGGGEIFSYFDVPPGARIGYVPIPPELPPEDFQSIRFTVPGWDQIPFADRTFITNGCGWVEADWGEEVVLEVNDECVAFGAARLLLETYHNGVWGHIHVTDIELGGPTLPPLEVPLADWQTYSFEGEFTITGVPAGLEGNLGIDLYQGLHLLQNRNLFLAPEAGTQTVIANSLVPNAGTSAWQTIQLWEATEAGVRTAESNTRRQVAFPYPAESSLSYSETLPIPALEVDGLQVTYSAITDPDVDRVVTDLEIANTTWRVWSSPAMSSFTLPSVPDALAQIADSGIEGASLAIEDRSDVQGYAQSFESWDYNATQHLTYVDWGPRFEYRTASQTWAR